MLKFTMGAFSYDENENFNGKAALRMHHAQFPDRRLQDHRTLQRLHRQLRETRSLPVTRHEAGQQRAVRSPILKESILNVAAL
ncbi:hypothetical protein TNCV_2989201 [Trichonephila clavipes]|nr:hypothetical protein TNCV_2989201 [Trichonephila clavipes]